MADTSNLSNFLTDVANAIRNKKETTEQIPAANFDTEIESIETGIDTSDADAVASDIINPKTAYVNGQKITGSIIPTYETATEENYTSRDLNAIGTPSSNLYVTTVSDGEYLFMHSQGRDSKLHIYKYNLDTNSYEYITVNEYMNCPIAGCTNFNITENNNINIIFQPQSTGNRVYFTIYNKDDNSFTNSSFTMTYLDTIYAFDVLKDDTPYVLTASRYSFSSSNRHLFIYLFIPTITNTNGNITISYSNDLIINATMKNITNFNYIRIINRSFGYWIGLAEGKMQTIFIYPNNDTQYNRLENDAIIPNPSLNYAIVNGEIKSFSIDINNETYQYSDLIEPIKLYESNELAMGKWIGDDVVAIFKNESDSTDIYKIDFDTNTKILLYSGTIIDLDGIKLQAAFNTDNAFVLNENTLGYNAFVKNQIGDSELTKLTKDGKDYLYQSTTSATANDIRRGRTAYSNGEKLIGSMIDNGTLNYTPSTEQQTIPMGYTSGGTIAAISLTETEYDECLELSQEILGGKISL